MIFPAWSICLSFASFYVHPNENEPLSNYAYKLYQGAELTSILSTLTTSSNLGNEANNIGIGIWKYSFPLNDVSGLVSSLL